MTRGPFKEQPIRWRAFLCRLAVAALVIANLAWSVSCARIGPS